MSLLFRTLRPSPNKNEKELHKSLKHVWGKIKDHIQLAQLKMKGHLELSQMAVKEHFEVSNTFLMCILSFHYVYSLFHIDKFWICLWRYA